MSEFGNPTFYGYTRHVCILPSEIGSGLPVKEIVLLEFELTDLSNPKVEPVCIYHQAGIRRYLWRDTYWAEIDILRDLHDTITLPAHRDLSSADEISDMQDLIGRAASRDSKVPLPTDVYTPNENAMHFTLYRGMVKYSHTTTYVRSIYRAKPPNLPSGKALPQQVGRKP